MDKDIAEVWEQQQRN